MDYIDVVEKVNKLLCDYPKWEERYDGYVESINEKRKIYKDKKFRIIYPLSLYTSVSEINNNNYLKYDIRFCGQSIAIVNVKDDVRILTKGKDKANKNYFNVDIQLNNEIWRDKKAYRFRAAFTEELHNKVKVKSQEHKDENFLLEEFAKKGSADKTLCNIQPITLCGAFFQMPTSIAASKLPIENKAAGGGNIDILARIRHKKGKTSRICVMELKDKNISGEPPEKAMGQAVAYATFIARLLRSKSGNEWYNIFGFKGNVPKKIVISVAVVMPYNEVRNENFETIEEIKVSENTYLKLYSLYFKEDENGLRSFVGSLKDDMLIHNKN